MDVFKLSATLSLDTSGFEEKLNKSSNTFQKLGGTVNAGAIAIGNLASSAIQKAAGALIDFGKNAYETGSSFEAAMDNVAAISGAVGGDFTALNEKAKEMGATTAFSATEAAEAFQYMAMAGWKTGDMLDGIAGVMNLAAASGESLGTVSDIVTDVITAMGYAAEDSGKFADVLAAASSNANTNVSMMGETFKYVAPVAGAMGYSIEDLAIATGLMANSSIKGSQAGTALRAILTNMTKPTNAMSKAMKTLGISATHSDGSMKSLREVMLNMREAFSGLTEAQQTQYAATIAGQEGMSALLAIVNASEADFEKLTNAVDGAAGTAETMAGIMQDNVAGAMEELGGAMETLYINVFEKLQEPLKNTINSVAGVVSALNEAFVEGGLSGMVQAAGGMLRGFAAKVAEEAPEALGEAGQAVANAIVGAINTAFRTEITELEGLSEEIKRIAENVGSFFSDAFTWFIENEGFLKGVLLGTAGSLALIAIAAAAAHWPVAALATAATLLMTNWQEFKAWYDESALAEIFSGTGGDLAAISENFGNWVAQQMPEEWLANIGKVALWFGDISTSISSAITGFGEWVAQKMPEDWLANIGKVALWFGNIDDYIAQALNNFGQFVDKTVPEPFLKALEKIKGFFDGIASSIKSAYESFTNFLGIGGGNGDGSGAGRYFAVGLDYVPYNNFQANLHRGEAVLTATEAEDWRRGRSEGRGGVTVVQNIYSEAKTAADLMREARWEQERGVLMGRV